MTLYTIKPPDWQEHCYDTGDRYAWADTPVGHLSVAPMLVGPYRWECRGISERADTYEAAKAAAEAWYRAKMAEGLEEMTPAMISLHIRRAYCVTPEELAG